MNSNTILRDCLRTEISRGLSEDDHQLRDPTAHILLLAPRGYIANFIHTIEMSQEIGTTELGRHLHPMRRLFADDEIDIISKQIVEEYAIVLWGRDLRELVGVEGEHLTRHRRSIVLPRLQIAITDYSPSTVPLANKPSLPDFRTDPVWRILPPRKRAVPTRGIQLLQHRSYVTWDGSAMVLSLTQYVPGEDNEGVADYMIGAGMHITYYINVHEQPLVLKTCYGR